MLLLALFLTFFGVFFGAVTCFSIVVGGFLVLIWFLWAPIFAPFSTLLVSFSACASRLVSISLFTFTPILLLSVFISTPFSQSVSTSTPRPVSTSAPISVSPPVTVSGSDRPSVLSRVLGGPPLPAPAPPPVIFSSAVGSL